MISLNKIVQKLMIEDLLLIFCTALNPGYKIWVVFRTKLKSFLTFIEVVLLPFQCTGICLAETLIQNCIQHFSQLQFSGLWQICTLFSQPYIVTLIIHRYFIPLGSIFFVFVSFFYALISSLKTNNFQKAFDFEINCFYFSFVC